MNELIETRRRCWNISVNNDCNKQVIQSQKKVTCINNLKPKSTAATVTKMMSDDSKSESLKDLSYKQTIAPNSRQLDRRRFDYFIRTKTREELRNKRIEGEEQQQTNRYSRNRYLFSSLLSTSAVNLLVFVSILSILIINSGLAEGQQAVSVLQQQRNGKLPDLVSATSDEPIVALTGQDAFVSCVAKNLQNYTIIWRYTNEANAPGSQTSSNQPKQASDSITSEKQQDELGIILTAGRQRVISDDRFTVIQSHDTWLLKISNVRLSDTGTYICHTNSEPRVRVLRILSVVKPNQTPPIREADLVDAKDERFSEIDYNFTDCCRSEFVAPRCQRLCSFQQLASRFQSINIVHECYSNLPSITRCMVAGRNVTDCCQKRHIPSRCNSMCGHLSDISAMSVQDQSYCADYSASIMSCVAEGISTLPGQPELVIVEAVSSTTLKVSWQKVTEERELRKIDGWIINLTKLSSFEDTISVAQQRPSVASSSSSAVEIVDSTGSTATTNQPKVTSSFSSSSVNNNNNNSTPLQSLTIVDVMNNSSLAAMTKLLAASSGTISLKLDKHNNEFSIDNLKPYTVYQIQMFAYNSLGRSQLTDPIRALTLAPESDPTISPPPTSSSSSSELATGDAYVEPNLPDTRKCCLDRGVTLKRCLDTLCDPVEADRATIADLMICAPWSNVTFSCLSSRVNHTDCCKSRGVTPFCLSMCSGDIKRVDYRHFRCLTHMSTYTNCILESHNVLPSRPLNFTVGPITHSWAVLNWRPPRKHARSLQGYRIFWRRVEPVNSSSSPPAIGPMGDTGSSGSSSSSSSSSNEDFLYSSAEAATNPYLLDALQADTVYETFVVAVNRFGQSESSVRFVFQTLADPEVLANKLNNGLGGGDLGSRLPLHGNATFDGSSKNNQLQQQSYYNETLCCLKAGVHNACQQLCDYDMKVNDVSSLITTCNNQMPVIMRCMAGSRNSVPCCRNRGVSDHCLNVCAGLTEHSPLVVATRCAPDFGKIIRCMDEGSKQIPSAPNDLHTSQIWSDKVRIKWSPSPEDSLRTDVEYHVRYQQLQQVGEQPVSAGDLNSLIAVVPLHPLEHNLIMTTNQTEATVDKLKPNSRYSIYVTAENSYGISLPSLVLVIQTPDENEQNTEAYGRKATLGSPHSLEILRSDTESIVLKWIAPLFTESQAQIKYRVFYKLLGPVTNSSSAALSSEEPATGDKSNTNSESQPVQQVSSNWTILETSDTTVILRGLRYSSQYVITVQAFNKQQLGHMSEVLLAATAKPVPPTLNHPLVINNPIEGNNITIMCVALGQPTPQISMFINGLLVQKRTQPYVIYHLVNLVRGHLTITCFASNGQGKDYASVQSRTEVSVKFPSKAVAKPQSREISVNYQSIARLSCEVNGNPQPTIVWTFEPASSSSHTQSDTQVENTSRVKVLTPSERISTLLVSQFETPFAWTHTLTIKNVSQSDAGTYQCRSRNLLSESSDYIKLSVVDKISETFSASSTGTSSSSSSSTSSGSSETTPAVDTQDSSSSPLKQLEQTTDLMECCRSQNVSAKCLPVCSADGLDVEQAFKTVECQANLDKLMYCAADGSDHRNCCRSKQVPSSCLRWCSGAKLNIPALCFLSSAIDINQCFQEGRSLLPGPPRNVRVMLASESEHGENGMSNEVVATTSTSSMMSSSNLFNMDKLMNSQAVGNSNSNSNPTTTSDTTSNTPNSVISSMVMMMGDHSNHQSAASGANSNDPSSGGGSATSDPSVTPDTLTHSEPLIIEWDPPAKNPSLVQYYRIFWRPFGSRELSRTVTNLTWIKLNDLSMNKIYEFVVKAANVHGSSVYSDPLTVKPAEIMAQSNSIGTAGLIWFMPSSGAASLFGRVMMAISFATLFMFGSLALVMLLEKRGYLKRFASSKSNSSRISFANPAYLKDSDGNHDGDNITWETNGHSLDILAPPTPPTSSAPSTPEPVPETSSENKQ